MPSNLHIYFKTTKFLSLCFITVFFLLFILYASELILDISNYKKKIIWESWATQGEAIASLDKNKIWKLKVNFGYNGYWDSDVHGFRRTIPENDLVSQKPKKTIVFLGDSFTYGHVKNSDTFSSKFKQLIASDSAEYNYIVINAGVPGYSTGQQYYYLVHDILPNYKVDLLIWNINQNDFFDNRKRFLYLYFFGKLIHFPAFTNGIYLQGVIGNIFSTAFKESNLFNLFFSYLQNFDFINIIQPPTDEITLKKMAVMFEDINKRTEKVVFIQTPDQFYFSELKNTDRDFYKDTRPKLDNLLHKFNYIDMNDEVAKFSQLDLNNLFLNESNFVFGTRHPAPELYTYQAKILEQYLSSKKMLN